MLQLLETRRHGLVLVRSARFATAPNPIVLADAAPSALLALVPFPTVLADAGPSAPLALFLTLSRAEPVSSWRGVQRPSSTLTLTGRVH